MFRLLPLGLLPCFGGKVGLFLRVRKVLLNSCDLLADFFNCIPDLRPLLCDILLLFVNVMGLFLNYFDFLQLFSPNGFCFLSLVQFYSFTFFCGSSFGLLSRSYLFCKLKLKFIILNQFFLDFSINLPFFISQRILGLYDFFEGLSELYLFLFEFIQTSCLPLLLEFPFIC